MMRLRRGVPALVALVGLAAFAAAPADAKTKRHHPVYPQKALPAAEPFPIYVDHGSDRNPGGDNLYFTDTKNPNYIVGPAWFQRWDVQ